MQLKAATTGITEIKDLQIQSPIQCLLIVKSGAAEIIDEAITLSLKTGGAHSKNVIPLTKLRRVAVISQFGQGYQQIQQMGGGVVQCSFLLELSDYAIAISGSDYLSLDLTNLVAASTYTVYGVESPVQHRSYNEYNTLTVTGADAQLKQYQVEPAAKLLALSNNAALSSIRMSYTNGTEVSYTPAELSAIMRQGNDVSFAADIMIEGDALNQTLQGGGTEFFVLPLTGCRKFDITTVGGIDLTVIQVITRNF